MKKKKAAKKTGKSKRLSNSKLLFLSLILLFIVFEALYLMKNQYEVQQANSLERSVAGVTIEK